MRFVDRWLWLVLVGYVLWSALGDYLTERPPASGLAGDTIRVPGHLPVVSLEGPGHRKGGSYIGTAFAVGASDDWLTARHVTDGCQRLALFAFADGDFTRPLDTTGNILHRSADLARLDAPHPAAGSLAVRAPADGRPPVRAWGHGFPQAVSAWVPVRFLATAAVADPRSGKALGTVWHVDHYPDLPVPYDLGGLSGGPLIDADGVVRGIIVGSDPRRARLVTIDPTHSRGLSDATAQDSQPHLDNLDPPTRDAILKRDGIVRLVDCQS